VNKTTKPLKKPYRRPVLTRYGDLRTLTGGGVRRNDESNKVSGPKTRLVGGPG
jgi:hypothetical protein